MTTEVHAIRGPVLLKCWALEYCNNWTPASNLLGSSVHVRRFQLLNDFSSDIILAIQAAISVQNNFDDVGWEVNSRLSDELRDILGGLQSVSQLSGVCEIVVLQSSPQVPPVTSVSSWWRRC